MTGRKGLIQWTAARAPSPRLVRIAREGRTAGRSLPRQRTIAAARGSASSWAMRGLPASSACTARSVCFGVLRSRSRARPYYRRLGMDATFWLGLILGGVIGMTLDLFSRPHPTLPRPEARDKSPHARRRAARFQGGGIARPCVTSWFFKSLKPHLSER
jgi:hypothetical protein